MKTPCQLLKSAFVVLIPIWILSGCANPDAPAPSSGQPVIQGGYQEKDMTNVAACTGPTPTNLKIESTVWHQDLITDQQLTATLTFQAEPGQLTIRKTCHLGSNTFVAEVKSPLVSSRDQIQVINAGSDETRLQSGNRLYSCKVDVNSNEVIKFNFIGPCLELQWRSKSLVFLPASL